MLHVVTARALKLESSLLTALGARLSARGAFLFWAGAEEPELPPGWVLDQERALPKSAARRLLLYRRLSR